MGTIVTSTLFFYFLELKHENDKQYCYCDNSADNSPNIRCLIFRVDGVLVVSISIIEEVIPVSVPVYCIILGGVVSGFVDIIVWSEVEVKGLISPAIRKICIITTS